MNYFDESRLRLVWLLPFILAATALAEKSEDQLRAEVNLAQHLARRPFTGQARNVVLVIGDASEVVSLASRRLQPGKLPPALKRFPYVGLCTAAAGTDSVCSASSASSLRDDQVRTNCSAAQNPQNQNDSLLRRAQLAGKSTGLVTGSRVTRGYSKGGSAHYYAHVADQDWESDVDVVRDGQDPEECDDIAENLILGTTGKELQVVLGWGRSNFRDASHTKDEECVKGKREDGADLIADWRKDKLRRRAVHSFIWDTQSLRAQNLKKTEYLLGLFEQSYNTENEMNGKPKLSEITEAALTILDRNSKGFVLVLEGRRGYGRSGDDEDHDLEDAIQRVLDLTNPQETLVVVTAQHAKMSAHVNNSAASNEESSGASVFARGPWAQLLTGTFEHLYIEHTVGFATCLGDGLTACTRR